MKTKPKKATTTSAPAVQHVHLKVTPKELRWIVNAMSDYNRQCSTHAYQLRDTGLGKIPAELWELRDLVDKLRKQSNKLPLQNL